MAEDKKSFVKITEQDIEIAKEFFEDENLLKDWIYNVCMYYMGEPQIHNDRLEEKYFNTYKKTMDFIIQAKNAGKVGAKNKKEKELNTSESINNKETLEVPLKEPLKGTLKEPLTPLEDTLSTNNKLLNINNKELIINNKVNNIEERKLKFSSTLSPYLSIYGKDLLNSFYKYWTEPNQSNTKFKKELEKTWSLERRLETWAKNDKTFNNNGKQYTKLNANEELAKRWAEIDQQHGINQEQNVSQTISERTIFDDYEEIP